MRRLPLTGNQVNAQAQVVFYLLQTLPLGALARRQLPLPQSFLHSGLWRFLGSAAKLRSLVRLPLVSAHRFWAAIAQFNCVFSLAIILKLAASVKSARPPYEWNLSQVNGSENPFLLH